MNTTGKLGFSAVTISEPMSDSKKKELTRQLLASREAMKKGTTSIPPPKGPKPQTRKAHRIPSGESFSPRSHSSKGGFSYNNASISQNGGRKRP